MSKKPAFPSKACEPEFASMVASASLKTTLPLRVLFTFVSHVTAHAKAAVKTEGLMAKACDAMIADKVTVAMFSKKTDDSDRAEDFRNGLKAAIIVSFTAADQRLLDTPTKGLSDTKKAHKRYMQQQIGARTNDYKRGLERRLKNGPAKKGADQNRTSVSLFVEERLVAIIKRCEKAEDATFDVMSVIETCRVALKIVHAKI
jgi:hypothetical protein